MSRPDWHPADVLRDRDAINALLSRAHVIAQDNPAAASVILELCALVRAMTEGGGEAP